MRVKEVVGGVDFGLVGLQIKGVLEGRLFAFVRN